MAGVKIIAGTIYSIVVALLFAFINMAGYFAAFGTIGRDAPLQSIAKYLASPYSFTIGQYFPIETLIYVIGGVCFGIIVMLVSALSHNALIPFFACGCLVGLPAFLKYMNVAFSAPFAWIKDFNYSTLIRVCDLFTEYKSYNIFGYPVLYLPVEIFVFAIISVIVLLLTIRVFRRHQITNA